MNYRHGFHAGNFADVLKHAIFARVLTYMNGKAAPYRVVDTHAGAGLYAFSEAAERTGEYRDGISKLIGATIDAEAATLLAPYLDAVREVNSGTDIVRYPGSPRLAMALARSQDRLVFCEKHPEEFASLLSLARADGRAKASNSDGWQALKSMLPPPERRGVVLIDPPFEQPDEFRQIAAGIEEAMRRFATGTYVIWYPVKNRHDADAALRRIAKAAGKETLRIEIEIAPPNATGALSACGVLVISPPWTLQEECTRILPALCQTLRRDRPVTSRLERIA